MHAGRSTTRNLSAWSAWQELTLQVKGAASVSFAGKGSTSLEAESPFVNPVRLGSTMEMPQLIGIYTFPRIAPHAMIVKWENTILSSNRTRARIALRESSLEPRVHRPKVNAKFALMAPTVAQARHRAPCALQENSSTVLAAARSLGGSTLTLVKNAS